MSSIFLPATVLPCCATYSLVASEISRPTAADVPVIGIPMPILTVSCAAALRALIAVAVRARSPVNTILLRILRLMAFPQSLVFWSGVIERLRCGQSKYRRGHAKRIALGA